MAKFDANQLSGLAYQAEASAHDIFTQFLGGAPTAAYAAEVSIEQARQQAAAAESYAKQAQAEADKQQAVAMGKTQDYTMIVVAVLAVAVIVAVARK